MISSTSLYRCCGLAGALLLCLPALAASTVSGTVTNRTRNKPAAGDDVVLIRLAQGMQEAARTKTDAAGRYTLDVPDEGFHLIRVTHDKANYFHPLQPGSTAADIDVFAAAAKVAGISAEADVLRLQTDETGGSLRAVESFFIKNDSAPPMTQFSDRPFDFYLPEGAVIEGSAALAPGGMPVQASPVPLGEPNHFAFIFPIRPGETRFQITYHIPYNGKANVVPKLTMATDTVAVMLPKSMQFQAVPNAPYTSVSDEVNAQTYVARQVNPSQPLGFALTGSGQLPRDSQAGPAQGAQSPASGADGGAPSGTPDQTKFGGGLGNPVDPGATNDPWAKYRWWVLGGLGLLLASGAGLMLRQKPADGSPASDGAARDDPSGRRAPRVDTTKSAPENTLHALKEELFALESSRLRGRIADAEYREVKSALETLMRHVLERDAAPFVEGPATHELSETGMRG